MSPWRVRVFWGVHQTTIRPTLDRVAGVFGRKPDRGGGKSGATWVTYLFESEATAVEAATLAILAGFDAAVSYVHEREAPDG